MKCPKCSKYTKAKSINQNDLNRIASSFAVEIVRKNLNALNRFADDSSKYTDFNKIIESTVLDLDKLELVRRKHTEEDCLECKGGLCFIDFAEGLHKGLKDYKESKPRWPLPELGVKLRHNPNLIWEGKDLQAS
jgi:hypothetical protein